MLRSILSCTLLALLLVGCGTRTLETGPTVPTLVQFGGGPRAVTVLTDLDVVRDATRGSEHVFVATDRGLLIHPASAEGLPVRVTRAQGLPSDDVQAVALEESGAAVVATPAGFARVSTAGEVSAFGSAPPVGRVTVLTTVESHLWAGGVLGLARFGEGGWERFGEEAAVTTLVPTAAGDLWVGTTRGLWLVQGEVIREHGIAQGIPEGYVRDLAPVAEGEVLALLTGPTRSQLAYWNGDRWFGYTIEGLELVPVGLVERDGQVLLLTPGHAFSIFPEGAAVGGVPLTALSRSEQGGVRSYRARITPPEDVSDTDVDAESSARDVDRGPSRLIETPVALPTIEAPSFSVSPLDLPIPDSVYLLRRDGPHLLLADQNRGVTALDSSGAATVYRSLDLVDDRDLQIAVDASGNTWAMGRDGDVARFYEGGLQRVPVPDGVTPQCIASGPEGAYVLSRVGDVAPEGMTVRLYRVAGDDWTPVFDRSLVVQSLLEVPLCGVEDGDVVWAGLRIARESGEGTRMRGVAVFGPPPPPPSADQPSADQPAVESPVVYHRRGATPETDGPGALSMPDEIEGMDINQEGFAWFPSLTGAIRVGNHQAVVFGEARGVRGEVVSDVVVGQAEVGADPRVWVAAAEGVGYYENSTFEFRLPAVVQEARPISLAIDGNGNLWGAGPNGVVYYDGTAWQTLTAENGLPTEQLIDVEVDGHDRVWLLARDQVLLFTSHAQ